MTATTGDETNAGSDTGLTVREAAEAAGVSEATIRRRIKDGVIEGASPDVDGTWRVPSDQLDNVRVTRRPAQPRPSRTSPTFPGTEVVELRGKLAVEQTKRAAAEQLASEREQTITTLRRALDLLEHNADADPTTVKSGKRAGKKKGSDGSGDDLAVTSLVQTGALEPPKEMKPVKSAKTDKSSKSKQGDDAPDEKKSDTKKSGKGKKKRDKAKSDKSDKKDKKKADKKSG